MYCFPRLLRRPLTTASLFVVLLLRPSFAVAEQEVQRVFREGVEQFAEGHYQQALELFTDAYGTEPVARILYNIAMCHRALGQTPDSVNAFRAYLRREDPARMSQEVRDEVERLLGEAEGGHGDLVVRLSPTDATLTLDSIAVPSMWREAGTIAVEPGEHRLEAQLDGYLEARQDLSVGLGESVTVALELVPVSTPAETSGDNGTEGDARTGLGWWVWASYGVGVLSAAVAVVTGTLMLHYRSEYIEADVPDVQTFDRTVALAYGTDALIAVASALVLVGVIATIVHYARRGRSNGSAQGRREAFDIPRALSYGFF